MKPRLFFAIGIAAICGLMVILLQTPLSNIENQFTVLKHQLRGSQPVDSNIVIIYVDNDAIATLGWPVRRNFYALMVKALNELGARAVGIEVQFENASQEYPEYDDLLTAVMAQSGNIVLTSYFGTLPAQSDSEPREPIPALTYPNVRDVSLCGDELHLPMEGLIRSAAGIGHVNIMENSAIPIFIVGRNGIVPSFGMELLRISLGAARHDVRFEQGVVRIFGPGDEIEFSCVDDNVTLDLPLSLSGFRSYPLLEVLRSYDALRADLPTTIPVKNFKDKIILVGVVAEGRSVHVSTALHPRIPSLVYHATFLDNALRSAFPSTTGSALIVVLCVFLALICSCAILFLGSPMNKVVAFGAILVAFIVSFIQFMIAGVILPVAPLLVVGLISTVSSLFFRHRFVREQVTTLQAEKETIGAQLRDREAKLAVLERELLDFETRKSDDRTQELLEEIRSYKAEIRALSSKADDMEEFVAGPDIALDNRAEFEQLVYASNGRMKSVVDFVGKIATSDSPVMILGESGTGKELVARALHKRSNRASGAFVAVNCGALSESLLESELFGHERGAFTGAVKDKAGRFELANGGTIFLDEIGEVNEGFQLKLLRVLQEGELERVGGTRTLKINVRVVAATNKDMKEQVKAKKFREDLFYRLNVLAVELPPLRERQEDIPLLIRYFLQRESANMKLSKNVMDALQNYLWPGNIRELESAIKRAVLLAKADNTSMITMNELTEEISSAIAGTVALEDQVLESMREKQFSRSAITETAAELGGLNRGTVAEYLRGEFLKAFAEHGFNRDQTIRYISLTVDSEMNDRVSKRLNEYLANIAEGIDPSQPWEVIKGGLKPKAKNLPQRYHKNLEQVGEAFFRGLWKLGS
ncbi:MAG: sigma 54-interacting transcriptional regulator [Bacteroidota bacterium]